MEMNYISIYDNSGAAKIIYVSESVHDVLGFTPKELVGLSGYELLHPDEKRAISIFHTSNLTNEPMSSLITYQSRHKDGHYVTCDIVVHASYDVMICTNFKRVSGDSVKASMRASSAADSYVIDEDGSLHRTGNKGSFKQYRMKSSFSEPTASLDNNGQAMAWRTLNWEDKEPRFCLILNRFTEAATIVFASRCCAELVGLDQAKCIGYSLYDFIADDDYLSVSSQLDSVKAKSIIAHFQFKWLCGLEEIPVEAVADGTYDGIVMVVRLATDLMVPPS